MNAEIALIDETIDFVDSYLGSIGQFKSAPRNKTTRYYTKYNGVENRLVVRVKGAIDEDARTTRRRHLSNHASPRAERQSHYWISVLHDIARGASFSIRQFVALPS